ncbi:ATP-binding protein [Candidatus Paracaedibacter symbiosus]|uniref:ATP-binding protein n=1 Tax=Candidatus Paracaedibacter symbiosus TaxID=244582 RepID=UPI00068E8927|nr:ATP-binding protein [Candidatus Paracaedibacter symbiosus]
MSIAPLSADVVGLPRFNIKGVELKTDIAVNFFGLSSHTRAKEALAFGLKMRSTNAHMFVVAGEDSGRMTGTIEFLKESMHQQPPVFDWVYLNNFISSHRPLPFRLPAGIGCQLQEVMREFIDALRDVLQKTFSNAAFVSNVNSLTAALETEVQTKIDKVQGFANTKGLQIESGPDEFTIITLDKKGKGKEAEKLYTQQDIQEIRERIGEVTSAAHISGRELSKKIQCIKKEEAEKVMGKLVKPLVDGFSAYLGEWIDELQKDILEHIDDFLEEDSDADIASEVSDRYVVNLLVDNRGNKNPSVIIDPAPTYESLFGSIKYRTAPTGYTTDFAMIRAGNLHRANGGILVLRAEALANNGELWLAIKTALRDKKIRIEERHRENSMPMLDAPDPKPIPLDVQIVLVGAPMWYYSFFFNDPDFRSYFRIKADIEPDLPATQHNIDTYAKLIHFFATEGSKKSVELEAIQYMLGYSCRWTNHRERFSSKFEVLGDIIGEAAAIAAEAGSEVINLTHAKEAFYNRRVRNSILEDRSHRDIESGVVLIDTAGASVGQINALTVINTGDHQYGMPNRVSARTYVGEEGIINIERLTELGGPIQQKGAMILDGYLNGVFAQKHPVSCNCSLTFEQNYGEVEGDSASLGELIAILSSLSQIPIRQDLAVTGSVNQFGQVQAVGGLIHKIEGFFRICNHRVLTGSQGVIIPKSNMQSLILREEITNAIREEKFFIWAVDTVEEAVEILMEFPAGRLDKVGNYPKNTVFYAVMKQLKDYQKSLDRHHKISK